MKDWIIGFIGFGNMAQAMAEGMLNMVLNYKVMRCSQNKTKTKQKQKQNQKQKT